MRSMIQFILVITTPFYLYPQAGQTAEVCEDYLCTPAPDAKVAVTMMF